jgi:Domain of unknown function (4846)
MLQGLVKAGLTALAVAFGASAAHADVGYAWRSAGARAETIAQRFPPPQGFRRQQHATGSFAAWLAGLPLKPAGASVLLHTGQPKARQDVHAAVIDIDAGTKDLQQCADAVMRLRAEWLFAAGRAREIAFNDTGAAKPMSFARWAEGERPKPQGRGLVWSRIAAADASYASFRRYMDSVFAYAGTYSLDRELTSVTIGDVQPGDVFIKGGFPGHAVLVVDVVTHAATGEKRLLLAQSFMPAQEIHILKDPARSGEAWWFPPPAPGQLFLTPEWPFPPDSLKRWR